MIFQHFITRRNLGEIECSMKPTENAYKYELEQKVVEEARLKKWGEQRSKEVVEKGADVYLKSER